MAVGAVATAAVGWSGECDHRALSGALTTPPIAAQPARHLRTGRKGWLCEEDAVRQWVGREQALTVAAQPVAQTARLCERSLAPDLLAHAGGAARGQPRGGPMAAHSP